MNTKYFLIFWICIFFIVIGWHYWLDQKFPKQETPEPPAEMNKGMSNPVDGDSLLIVYRERLDTLFNTRGVGTLKIEYAGETQYWFQVEGYEIKRIDSLHSAIIIKQRY